jgi:hypothetical protein
LHDVRPVLVLELVERTDEEATARFAETAEALWGGGLQA